MPGSLFLLLIVQPAIDLVTKPIQLAQVIIDLLVFSLLRATPEKWFLVRVLICLLLPSGSESSFCFLPSILLDVEVDSDTERLDGDVGDAHYPGGGLHICK
jgi:hypothetical protein